MYGVECHVPNHPWLFSNSGTFANIAEKMQTGSVCELNRILHNYICISPQKHDLDLKNIYIPDSFAITKILIEILYL